MSEARQIRRHAFVDETRRPDMTDDIGGWFRPAGGNRAFEQEPSIGNFLLVHFSDVKGKSAADADAKDWRLVTRCYLTQRIVIEALVSGLQDDDEACRFGFVGLQFRKGRITPAGKAYDFPSSNFRFQRFGRFQDVKAAVIDKERMIPKHAMQLRNRRMIVGKNLSLELAQGLFQLCRIQLHDYSCFCLQPFGVRAIIFRRVRTPIWSRNHAGL